MQQATDADRESYAELLKYGTSVVSHLAAIRGRPVNPPAPSKLLGVHDARRVADSLQKSLPRKEATNSTDPPIRYIFHRAPPSIRPLNSLKKLRISELKWCEVHRGGVLVLRNISPARRVEEEGGVLATVVEDEYGSALMLRLFNYPTPSINSASSVLSPEDLLSPGLILAIKEPYCEAASEATSGLRVNHPSDIALVDDGHSLVPERWRRNFGEGQTPAEVLKEEGNAAFKKGVYDVAVLRYTEALNHSPSPQLRVTLLLNRAQASLQRGNWISAYADCSVLLSLPSSPSALSDASPPPSAIPVKDLSPKDVEKALYRTARALFALSVYKASLPLLESLLKSAPSNKDAQTLSNKTSQRIREEEAGKYDWAALLKDARTPAPRVDVADYVGPVQLSTGNGSERKSWRASRDVKAGELLLASKALTVLYPSDLSSVGESEGKGGMVFDATRALLGGSEGWEMTRRIAESVSADPNGRRVRMAMGLAKDAAVYDSRLGEEIRGEDEQVEGVTIVDERAVIDVNVLDSIRTTHTLPFSPLPPLLSSPSQQSTGLAFNPTTALPYLSHSCLPNSSLSYIADLCIVRAAQPIARGDLITVARVFSGAPREERWAELEKMGASGERKCSCRLCEIEEREGDAPRSRRVELVQQVKALAEQAPSETLRTDPLAKSFPNRPKEADVLQITKAVEKIVDDLDATYTHSAKAQPRFAILEPLAYLFACYLYLGREYTELAVKANTRYISALGWAADYGTDPNSNSNKGKGKGKERDDGPDLTITSYGSPHPPLVRALVQQSSVFWQLGKRRTAASWKREAEKLAEVVSGCRTTFKEAFSGVYEGLSWEV